MKSCLNCLSWMQPSINFGNVWWGIASGRYAVVHLALAGWLRLGESVVGDSPPARTGPLAVRLDFDDGARLDFTEQCTRKGMALWITDNPDSFERIQRLGPDVDAVSLGTFAEMLSAMSSRLKTVLTDQTIMAGIGNAWADEILHCTKLSPFTAANKLDVDQVRVFHEAFHEGLDDVRTALAEVAYVGRPSV